MTRENVGHLVKSTYVTESVREISCKTEEQYPGDLLHQSMSIKSEKLDLTGAEDQMLHEYDDCITTNDIPSTKNSNDQPQVKSERNSILNGDLNLHRQRTDNQPFRCDNTSDGVGNNGSYRGDGNLHETLVKMETNEKSIVVSAEVEKVHYSVPFESFQEMQTSNEERKYKCDQCDKSFIYSFNLTTHQRIHTGEKPFSCDICSKSFSRSNSMKAHKRIHTGEKPFNCDICNKGFCESSSLTTHKRKHTGEKPFTCNICYKSFSHSSNMTKHKKKHSGEKPFTCDICFNSFSEYSSLVKHKRKHTGEKPFTCNICNKSFSHSSNLTKHKRKHT